MRLATLLFTLTVLVLNVDVEVQALCRPRVAHFMRHHERFLDPIVDGEGRIDSVLRTYGIERAAELPDFLEKNGFSPQWTFVTELIYSWQSALPVIRRFRTPVSYYGLRSPGAQDILDTLDKLDGNELCPDEVLVMSHGPFPCPCPPPVIPICMPQYYVDVTMRALGYTGEVLDICEFGNLFTLRVEPGGTNDTVETRIRYRNPPRSFPPTPLRCAVPQKIEEDPFAKVGKEQPKCADPFA